MRLTWKSFPAAAIIMFSVLAAVFLSCASAGWAIGGSGDGCKRRAVLSEVKSNHPFFIENGTAGLHSSLNSRLVEIFTTNYFHLLYTANTGRPRDDVHPPEYLFKANYEIGLNVPSPQQKPIVSRLHISLYFNGEREEFMETWVAESSIEDLNSLTNRMFKGPNAILKRVKPIENLLWDFECRPVKCQVNMHGNTSVKPGEEIEIELSEFRDSKGHASKPFQRIILQAKEGKILNGEPLEADKDMKVFVVGNDSVTIRYKAPDSPEVSEDILWVNSSCDVLPEAKYPLSRSEMYEQIAEQKIPIGYFTVMAVIESTTGACSVYPFSYTLSMEFAGVWETPFDEKTFGKEGAARLTKLINMAIMPPELFAVARGKEAVLLARLMPQESSLKVINFKCNDPENKNSPPATHFPRSPAEAHYSEAAVEIWLIEETVYFVRGGIEGIGWYFEGEQDDPGGANPAGGSCGDMMPYLEIPLKKLLRSEPVEIRKEHSGSDGDLWSWTTHWTIKITTK